MRRIIEKLLSKARDRKIAVIGVGTFSTLNMRFLIELGLDICFFVDSDYKNRKYFEYQTGFKVMPYQCLDPMKHFSFVYQHNYEVVDSIVADLHRQGFGEQDYLVLSDVVNQDLLYKNMLIGKGASSYDVMLDWNTHVKSIGRYSSINRTVQIVFDHNLSSLTTVHLRYAPLGVRERLMIGHDVWMGANVVINASKVKSIGNGAIIGTGAVVIEDVPPYAIMAGVPAKVKKYRFTPQQIETLERVQWWNWDDETMKANKECFANPELFFEKFGH